jgi:hypothetical protein
MSNGRLRMMTAMRPCQFRATPWIIAAIAGAATCSLFAETVDFSNAKPGKLPPNWVGTQTGKGQAQWSVEKDSGDPVQPSVLKQSGEAAYPLCIKDDAQLKNGVVEVRFKPVSGKEDQAGGVIWRVKDPDNYYVCRANALEDNVVLYRTVGGKRSVLPIVGRKEGYGVKAPVAPAAWHTLRVEFNDHLFKVIFDGKHLFDVEDSTFTEAGKVGLWTKADSVTLFNDFKYGNGK